MKRTAIRRHPRPEAETIRIHGEPEFRAWIKRQPCVFARLDPDMGEHAGESVAAHIKGDGTSRKADVQFTVPMCHSCHDRYDGRAKAGGRLTFLSEMRLTMEQVFGLAERVHRQWGAYLARQVAAW